MCSGLLLNNIPVSLPCSAKHEDTSPDLLTLDPCIGLCIHSSWDPRSSSREHIDTLCFWPEAHHLLTRPKVQIPMAGVEQQGSDRAV